jgi:WD40-like Beta Propeller Repeat
MSNPHPKLTDAHLKEVLVRRSAGVRTSAELIGDVLAAVETVPQGRRWSLRLAPQQRLLPVLLVTALLLSALIGSALLAGSRNATLPAGSGLIAYESGGDIYVGDPATGQSTSIVTGPEVDGGPIFSPDGTRIAFYRSPTRPGAGGALPTTASIVIVRADGSDERVIVSPGLPGRPDRFPGRGLGSFSWTPDGASILVEHDVGRGPTGGYVSLFDASGVAEPLALTPPLPRWPGGAHPQTGGEVAPMFRPPTGDRMLSYPDPGPPAPGTSTLVEMDIDGSDVTVLVDPAKTDVPFQVIHGAVWSPDARWIALAAGDRCRGPDPYGSCYSWLNQRILILSSDGSQVRRLTAAPADVDPGRHIVERAIAWSPDGSRILIERTTAESLEVADLDTQTFPITGQTLTVEVATGAERAITALASGVYGPPYGGPHNGIQWVPSVTSSWSPDGRNVLVFEGPGTRPIVIDVETGTSTELPWRADSHPSWGRATPNPG